MKILNPQLERNFKIFNRNKLIRLKRMVWKGLCMRRENAFAMSKTMCNLEYFMRNYILQEAMKSMKSFVVSKYNMKGTTQKRAISDMMSVLNNFHD